MRLVSVGWGLGRKCDGLADKVASTLPAMPYFVYNNVLVVFLKKYDKMVAHVTSE